MEVQIANPIGEVFVAQYDPTATGIVAPDITGRYAKPTDYTVHLPMVRTQRRRRIYERFLSDGMSVHPTGEYFIVVSGALVPVHFLGQSKGEKDENR